ncbi:hypothetical protein GQ42DRAFT_70546 [Ramicandelaber brevisporus]|nr:hypothetical protein GQ42DRAFT_70546 [Ramicandelaber brevisporus]
MRRSTINSYGDNGDNNAGPASGIPQPSVNRPRATFGARQSMLPSVNMFGGGGIGGGFGVPPPMGNLAAQPIASTPLAAPPQPLSQGYQQSVAASRMSIMQSQQLPPPPRASLNPMTPARSRQSIAPASVRSAGRTSLNTSSVYAAMSSANGNSAGILPSSSSVPPKDPRNTRDAAYQEEAQRFIIEYLQSSGFKGAALSSKTLKSPTSNDFKNIFTFLFAKFDPNFPPAGKKFSEEAHAMIKLARFPYASEISRNAFMTIGSSNSWPAMVGMLHWMCEVGRCLDCFDRATGGFGVYGVNGAISEQSMNEEELVLSGQAPTAQSNGGVITGFEEYQHNIDEFLERIQYAYLVESYYNFINHVDDGGAAETQLSNRFDKFFEHIIDDVTALEKNKAELENQLRELTDKVSPLQEQKLNCEEMQNDLAQFMAHIGNLQQKVNKEEQAIDKLKDVKVQRDEEINQLKKKRTEKEYEVANQKISHMDARRMNSEKEQLTRTKNDLLSKEQKATGAADDKEIELQRVMDDCETMANEYNSKVLKLSSSLQALPAAGVTLEKSSGVLNLQVNANAKDSESMTSLDLRDKARQVLFNVRNKLADTKISFEEELCSKEEELSLLVDQKNEIINQVEELSMNNEALINKVKIEDDRSRESIAQILDEINQMDNQIQQLKLGSDNEVAVARNRVRRIKAEYEQLQDEAAQTLDTAQTSLVDFIEKAMRYKDWFEKESKALQTKAEDELNYYKSMQSITTTTTTTN